MHFAPAQAAEIEVSSRYIDQKSKSEFVKVGDKEGHVVGSYSTTGVETYDNGEIALRFVGGTFDFVNWAGPVAGRTLVVHEDGSTITYEWEGATKFDEKKASFSEGTHRCASGTGRFEGIKCEGTWKVNHQKNGMHLGSHKTKMKLPD
jgi:hypothetical protein